jgi:hypothetical protein
MVSFLSRVVERIGQASRRPGGSGKRIRFKKLNEGWNAEPNAPDPKVNCWIMMFYWNFL